MMLYTLVAVIVPLMFPCTSSGCVLDDATGAGNGPGFPGSPSADAFRPPTPTPAGRCSARAAATTSTASSSSP